MHGNHAVVIGASISGLTAARVLSERFDHVTVVERDALPFANDHRRGVPQGRHGHGLLASGFNELRSLFPGLEEDLVAGGAEQGDVIGDFRWFQHGFYKAKFASGLTGILLSRPLLEGTLRRRVAALSNVAVVDRTHVIGVTTDANWRHVNGVRIQRATDDPVILSAELVIDASGRGSRTPMWLSDLRFPRPVEETVAVDLGYTTRTFKRRARDLNGDLGVVIGPTPPSQRRVGFMLTMEGGRWIVSLGGWLGDHAPTDARGFIEFARSLPRPDIYDVIKDAEPLTEAVAYGFPSNLRRRYERLHQFPGRYLVMGDAMCSFNPFYGQGMSVAALEAQALARTLDTTRSLDELWRPYFRAAGKIVETPWTIAAGSDFAFRGVAGRPAPGTHLINRYLARVHQAASSDRGLCRTFFDVANLLKPATTLFRPTVLARVARGALWPGQPQEMPPPIPGQQPPVARPA